MEAFSGVCCWPVYSHLGVATLFDRAGTCATRYPDKGSGGRNAAALTEYSLSAGPSLGLCRHWCAMFGQHRAPGAECVWGVCVGQREINFDDMELSLRGIHRTSLEETCSELGLIKAQPGLKGGRLREKCQQFCQRGDPCAP